VPEFDAVTGECNRCGTTRDEVAKFADPGQDIVLFTVRCGCSGHGDHAACAPECRQYGCSGERGSYLCPHRVGDGAAATADELPGILITVGDVIQRGRQRGSETAMLCWTGEKAEDAQLICLVPPVGDGQWAGTAMRRDAVEYLGWLPETADRDEGHYWRPKDGPAGRWRRVDGPWWDVFRGDDSTQGRHRPAQ